MSSKKQTLTPGKAAVGMLSSGAANAAFLNVKFATASKVKASNVDDAPTAIESTGGRIPKVADAADEGIARALLESREELQQLSGLLLSIQEDERRRIALDLHDGLGQSLSLIKLAIEKSGRLLAEGAITEAGESLRQLLPRVDEALLDVRRVSTELRPLMLDDLGIMPTLSWFFREFETLCGGIVVEREFNVAECDVPVPLHITVYRILQEAFHNIVKHSAADRVRVGLERVDDALHLVIEDNGRGFDPESAKFVEGQTRGLGLLSMKERASFSGGSYSLNSAPGQGTCIKVSWSAGTCPASIDCCRASGSIPKPCGAMNAKDGEKKIRCIPYERIR